MRPHRFEGIFLYRIVSPVVISCYIAGCSLYGPTKQGIGITSDPSGAQVLLSGKPMGTTPLQLEVDRGENLLLEVHKSGYHTQLLTSSRKLSGLGILDVVSGFFWLVPFVGLTASGAWEHDPSEFEVFLKPQNGMTPTP